MVKNILQAMALSCLLCIVSYNALALEQGHSKARQIVEKFQDDLIGVMKNGKALGYSGRYDKLKESVSNSHDLSKIARIVVGKEWEKLTEPQQQQLSDVFSKLSIASYAHNFKDYSGESFTF